MVQKRSPKGEIGTLAGQLAQEIDLLVAVIKGAKAHRVLDGCWEQVARIAELARGIGAQSPPLWRFGVSTGPDLPPSSGSSIEPNRASDKLDWLRQHSGDKYATVFFLELRQFQTFGAPKAHRLWSLDTYLIECRRRDHDEFAGTLNEKRLLFADGIPSEWASGDARLVYRVCEHSMVGYRKTMTAVLIAHLEGWIRILKRLRDDPMDLRAPDEEGWRKADPSAPWGPTPIELLPYEGGNGKARDSRTHEELPETTPSQFDVVLALYHAWNKGVRLGTEQLNKASGHRESPNLLRRLRNDPDAGDIWSRYLDMAEDPYGRYALRYPKQEQVRTSRAKAPGKKSDGKSDAK